MGCIIFNAYVNLCQALEPMERYGRAGIWNPYREPGCGFCMSRDFTSKMPYYQKTGHLLAKINTVRLQSSVVIKFLKLSASNVLLPKDVSMGVPRWKFCFFAHTVVDLCSAVLLKYQSSTNLSSAFYC